MDNIEQPSVKSFLKQQGTWEQRYDKEKQEYLAALNKQEVAEKVWPASCFGKRICLGAERCEDAIR